jgi:hypothetical protein
MGPPIARSAEWPTRTTLGRLGPQALAGAFVDGEAKTDNVRELCLNAPENALVWSVDD